MREIIAATAHTVGYIVVTGAAVWLIFTFVPNLPR